MACAEILEIDTSDSPIVNFVRELYVLSTTHTPLDPQDLTSQFTMGPFRKEGSKYM